MPTKRLFFAVDLTDESLDALEELQQSLAPNVSDSVRIRWTPRSNLHLTLKFLGSHEADLVDEFGRTMDEVVSDVAPFELTLSGLGAFPHPNNPRILWVGADEESSALLATLHSDIQKRLEPYGVEEDEHPFKAHVTVGRVKSNNSPPLRSIRPEQLPDDFGTSRVDSVTLYESELDDTGATYHLRHRSPFRE